MCGVGVAASAEMPPQDVLLPFLEKPHVQKSQRQVHEEVLTPDLCVPGKIARFFFGTILSILNNMIKAN